MSDAQAQICIYPGCDRPAVPAHELGGPQPRFCDLEEHNAGSTHLALQRLRDEAGEAPPPEAS